MKYLLGYDLGSSSVKICLLDLETGATLASAGAPDVEMHIDAPKSGWAEQNPEDWWAQTIAATQKLQKKHSFDPKLVAGIGISYQMHGLVLIDKNQKVLRPSIIWCDSRAVEIGQRAQNALGEVWCLENLLNSPGNFTASKMRWVIENEPKIAEKIDKWLLPGDFLALKMTGDAATTVSGLSEGIFWDFKKQAIARPLLNFYGISTEKQPDLVPTFGNQGKLSAAAATALGLAQGTHVTYRAGDQPNNAFSLNVLNPGEIAATAGTSGVIYGITDRADGDPKSRVNTFVHVNNSSEKPRNGVLLCVNGTGILNSWLRQNVANGLDYAKMNALASEIPIGSDGLICLPFGNGAERMLENRQLGAHFAGLDLTRHRGAHLLRAGQEGIVFSLKYGLDLLKTTGVTAKTIRAGKANMFLSPLFREAFANTTGAVIELFDTDGAAGAARGAGVGAGVFSSFSEAFSGLKKLETIEPTSILMEKYGEFYQKWLKILQKQV